MPACLIVSFDFEANRVSTFFPNSLNAAFVASTGNCTVYYNDASSGCVDDQQTNGAICTAYYTEESAVCESNYADNTVGCDAYYDEVTLTCSDAYASDTAYCTDLAGVDSTACSDAAADCIQACHDAAGGGQDSFYYILINHIYTNFIF